MTAVTHIRPGSRQRLQLPKSAKEGAGPGGLPGADDHPAPEPGPAEAHGDRVHRPDGAGSSVSGIADMSKSIAGLTDAFNSGQALQAASMVGRDGADAGRPRDRRPAPVRQPCRAPSNCPPARRGFVRVYNAAANWCANCRSARSGRASNFSGTARQSRPAAPAGRYRVDGGHREPRRNRGHHPISRRRSRASRSRATAAAHKSGPTAAPPCASPRSRQSCKEIQKCHSR